MSGNTVRRATPILALCLVALLFVGGCAMQARSIMLVELTSSKPDNFALIRSGVAQWESLFERRNWATVTKVDGVAIKNRWSLDAPVIVSPGSHAVTIRFDKDSFICTYGECIRFKQSERSLVLAVEPGHSYLPQTKKHCGKDWIWIEDLGKRAEEDLAFWVKHRYHRLTDTSNRVVAGDAPPATCESLAPEAPAP